jgi:hypothetical protein
MASLLHHILGRKVTMAIFQMERDKSPGSDAFPAELYQSFWGIIKGDLMSLFSAMHVGQLELFHINFGEIILLLKVDQAEIIQQYRPIMSL